jgi:malate dehydrogenase
MKKITIIGAGRVGETAAQTLAQQEACRELTLLDIREGAAAGAALDIMQSAAYFGFDTRVTGGTGASLLQDAELVVVTAGSPRKPGMSRSDVMGVNVGVINNVCDSVREYAPDALLLIVTNPVDVLTHHAWKRTGWARNRVFGQAGVLDASRMAAFIAAETGLAARDVHPMVIGGHGDYMVPLTRYSTVNGVPASTFLDAETIERINERTRHGGAEVLSLRQNSSAYIAPAAAIAAMVDAICHDRRRVLPCVCNLEGEYGLQDITVGVPAILGRNGIEQIVELPLDTSEQAGFNASVEGVRADLENL